MQNYLKTLLNFRKQSSAIHHGKTIHFAPKNGIYLLFRIYEDEIVVLILNKNQAPMSLNLDRFKELNLEGKTFKNVISKDEFIWGKTLGLNKMEVIFAQNKINVNANVLHMGSIC